MSRKKVTRSLPSLAESVPGFRGFQPKENGSEAVAHILRKLAAEARQKQPHPFYSIREVAAHFRLTTSVVGRVYQRLAAEGLLIRKRGSMTLVPARRAQARIPVRGVVGMPIWTPGFLEFADWRLRFILLEHEFRRRNFIADLIFAEENELETPAFLDRLLGHELDIVLWTFPLPVHRQTMLGLADRGVRLVSITDRQWPFPGLQYTLHWEKSITEGLTEWKAAGISQLVVGLYEGVPEAESGLPRSAHAAFRVSYEVFHVGDEKGFIQRLATLPRRGVGLMLIDDNLCGRLYRESPREMIQLCRDYRVMQKPSINIPSPLVPDLRVDLIRVDWNKVAAQMAFDVAAGKDGKPCQPVPVFAEWKPRMSLDRLLLRD